MTAYYVSPTGSDSASGESLDRAWATFAYAATRLADGDTLWCAGGRYGARALDLFTASLNNISVAAIDENNPAILSHGIRVAQSAWAAVSGNVYRAQIGTGLTIAAFGVHKLWRYVVDSYGRAKSCMTAAVDLAACGAADNSYFYDSVGGWLNCNFGGDNPTSNDLYSVYEVEYVQSNSNSLVFITGNNNLVEGIEAENVMTTGGGPYGIRLAGTNNTIRGCKARNMQWHAIGNVGAVDVSGSRIEDCECWGHGQENSASLIVNFSSSNNISSVRIKNTLLMCYVPLKVDGTPVATLTGVVGAHQHTDGLGGRVVSDIQYDRVRARFFEQTGDAFTGGNTSTAAQPAVGSAAELISTNYPVRYRDCKLVNGYALGFCAGASFDRCNLLMPNRLTAGSPNVQTSGVSADHSLGFFATHVAVNLYSASSFRTIFNLSRVSGAASNIVSLNSSWVDVAQAVGEAAPTWPRWSTWSGIDNVGTVRVLGSIVQGDARKGITLSVSHSDSQATSSAHTWTTNAYTNIDGASNAWYYGTLSIDTQAEWQAVKDAGGEYAVTPGFADATVSAQLTLGGGLLGAAAKYSQTSHVDIGINGRPYSQRLGPWQDGGNASLLLELMGA